VKSIRLLLANIPGEINRALRDAVLKQDDIEVVGEERDLVQMLVAVAETNADVVVLAAPESGEEPAIVSHLLMEYPFLMVVALDPRRRRGCSYRFRTERTPVEFQGESDFLGMIHRAYWQKGPISG